MNALQSAINDTITRKTGKPFSTVTSRSLGGGCIHNASRITGEDGRAFFVKCNNLSLRAAFEAEAYALDTMAQTGTIRVPRPIGTCEADGQAALVLEFLPMGGSGSEEERGRQLARMHRSTIEAFGWPHDNWIGSTPQVNGYEADWVRFYREYRLNPQIRWARKNHLSLAGAEALLDHLPGFFEQYAPVPSLLHGDLWGGNASFMTDGTPVIFDPAAYYGDREADLAMTEMFGGFGAGFYRGYEAEWPLDPGYAVRKQLYILYHVLNHYNLFGGGYGSQAEAMIGQLLRAARAH